MTPSTNEANDSHGSGELRGALGDGDEPAQPVGAQGGQQVLLAGEPAVERADPDAGLLRDRGDRRVGRAHEDGPGRGQDRLVVARGLRLASAERSAHGRDAST